MSDHDHSDLEGVAEERAGPGDPASSHGSDLDARMGLGAHAEERTGLGHAPSAEGEPTDQGTDVEEAGP